MASKGISLQLRYGMNDKGKRVPLNLELVDNSRYTVGVLRNIRSQPLNFKGEVRR